jgi:flagellar hook-associated protein 1 FlgK
LRANQLALSLTSSNVANSDTPGYIRKTVNQIQTYSGSIGAGVSVTGVNRELDLYLQQQIRTEQSGASYADLRSSILSSLQSIYGTPGGTGTLETAFNNLVTAVQGLSTSSDSQSARIGVLNAAQSLTQQLNSMSGGIQSLRSQAEAGLNSAVNTANTAMQQIVNLNTQLQSGNTTDAAAAALKDQRDQYVDQLSQLMDIRVIDSRQQSDPGLHQFGRATGRCRGLDAVVQSARHGDTEHPVGRRSDQEQPRHPRGPFPERRFAQPDSDQFDPFRHHRRLSRAARQNAGAGANPARSVCRQHVEPAVRQDHGGNCGELGGVERLRSRSVRPAERQCNPSHLYGCRNVQHQLSLVRVDDPSVLPLSNNATTDPNDQVIGIDFSAGMASVTSQLNAALGSAGLQFSNTGSTLRVLDNGVGNRDRERRLRDVDHIIAAGRQRRGAVVSPTATAFIPARSPRQASSRWGSRRASG